MFLHALERSGSVLCVPPKIRLFRPTQVVRKCVLKHCVFRQFLGATVTHIVIHCDAFAVWVFNVCSSVCWLYICLWYASIQMCWILKRVWLHAVTIPVPWCLLERHTWCTWTMAFPDLYFKRCSPTSDFRPWPSIYLDPAPTLMMRSCNLIEKFSLSSYWSNVAWLYTHCHVSVQYALGHVLYVETCS
jgi:hypothetical protein